MSTTTTENKKKLILKSSDNVTFEVEEAVALISQTLKNIIEDGCSDDRIPLPNVTARTLVKVIEYCKKHVESPKTDADGHSTSGGADDAELKNWDKQFAEVDTDTLYDLIMAANYLNIGGLLDLLCQTVADMIKGKAPDEIRKKFNIKNDFTLEEEEQVRKENAWAFE